MISYPLQFSASSSASGSFDTPWSVKAGDHQTQCAIPTEFAGAGGAFSPEDLFALALTNCFVATFKVYAKNSRLEFSDITAEALLTVDQNDQKKTTMKHLSLRAKITGVSSEDKARLLAKKAFETGFILNSVKTELSFELSIE